MLLPEHREPQYLAPTPRLMPRQCNIADPVGNASPIVDDSIEMDALKVCNLTSRRMSQISVMTGNESVPEEVNSLSCFLGQRQKLSRVTNIKAISQYCVKLSLPCQQNYA